VARVGIACVWLVLPPLEIYLISLLVPVFLDRYLIWVMPAFVTLVACGVVALHGTWRPLGLATFGAVLAFNLLGVWMQDSQPIQVRLSCGGCVRNGTPIARGLAHFFRFRYNRYIYSYYAGQGQPWIDGPYTNSGQDQAFVDGWMARGTLGARQAWLIASEVPLWDARGLNRALVGCACNGRRPGGFRPRERNAVHTAVRSEEVTYGRVKKTAARPQ